MSAGATLVVVAAALALSGCGAEVPSGGVRAADMPANLRAARRVEPSELLPADLDLVVRVDLARMRASLGPDATARIGARAFAEAQAGSAIDAGSAWLHDALGRADVVWVGMRATDASSGDRVIVAEGRMGEPAPDAAKFRRAKTAVADVVAFDAVVRPRRDGVGRVLAVGDRALVFIAPVEIDAVSRVLRDGPDAARGDPAAEGIVSADLRGRPLPPGLDQRFPSIGAIIAGVERVRAVASLRDDGVLLDATLVGHAPDDAGRALRFLRALRDNVGDPAVATLLGAASLEQVDRTVHLRWEVPASAVLQLVGGADAPAQPTR